jgi:hypothetical protein
MFIPGSVFSRTSCAVLADIAVSSIEILQINLNANLCWSERRKTKVSRRKLVVKRRGENG